VPRAKQAILDWLAANKPVLVEPAIVVQIRQAVGDVTDHTLRHTLIESGYPLHPLVEGVNQSTPVDLARTLLVLADLYLAAPPDQRRAIRDMVIESKSHARFAAANRKLDAARRDEKRETLLWISTWVENPPLFASWLNVRLARTRAEDPAESAG
jgi:hypothetical protein